MTHYGIVGQHSVGGDTTVGRGSHSHVNKITSTNSRVVSKYRTTTNTGQGQIDSTQVLRPVFPTEESLDVQWDFNIDLMAFETEWLSEESHIRLDDRDGLGVFLNGEISTDHIDVWILYDETGDGTANVVSETKKMERATQTLTFDGSQLLREDGWYRVVVKGLRTGDLINQVDIGAVHANL